jgi:hypothetical protein
VEKFQEKFVYVFQTIRINNIFVENSSAKTGGIGSVYDIITSQIIGCLKTSANALCQKKLPFI